MKGAYMGGYSGIWDFPSLYDDEDYETRTLTVILSSSTTPMPVYEELKSAEHGVNRTP